MTARVGAALRHVALCAAMALVLKARAQQDPAWTTPLPPFRIADNLYYVGSRDLASYLVVTPQGDILINSNLEQSIPQIRGSIEQLGFHLADVKILLISHAHFDHAAGSAAIKQLTGARYMVTDADVPAVERGGRADFAFGNRFPFPPAKVDRVLHDGDQVRLGGTVLVAHKTPGHTRGCTTWTMQVQEHGRPLNVVIVGSWSTTSEYRLVNTPGRPASYPGIAEDFEHTFAVLHALPCDVFLGAHGSYFNLLGKISRRPSGERDRSPVWIDPAGYQAALTDREAAFHAELRREQTASVHPAANPPSVPARSPR